MILPYDVGLVVGGNVFFMESSNKLVNKKCPKNISRLTIPSAKTMI